MKQILTEEQWDKLSMKQKAEFNHYPVSIGDMIEYLGEDYFEAFRLEAGKSAFVYRKPDELVDALFEAVKFKLDKLL